METKELIAQLRSCGERNCPDCPEIESCIGPGVIMREAAESLEKLEKKYASAIEAAAIAAELAAKYRRTDGDLISRAALIEEYEWLKSQTSECNVSEIEEHIARIRRAPAVAAEPVVRCEKCTHYSADTLSCALMGGCGTNWYGEDYCSYGAHMDEEQELRTCYCPVCDKHFEVRSNASYGNCRECGHHVALHIKEVADV